VEIGSGVWAVWIERQNKKNNRHATRIFHHLVGASPPTKLGGVVEPWDVIILAKYEIKLFIIVTLVSG